MKGRVTLINIYDEPKEEYYNYVHPSKADMGVTPSRTDSNELRKFKTQSRYVIRIRAL